MSILFERNERETAEFAQKVRDRHERKLYKSIVGLRKHFRQQGDNKAVSKNKVNQLLRTVAMESWLYSLGDDTPLKDAIPLSVLPFMDQPAKDAFLLNL